MNDFNYVFFPPPKKRWEKIFSRFLYKKDRGKNKKKPDTEDMAPEKESQINLLQPDGGEEGF